MPIANVQTISFKTITLKALRFPIIFLLIGIGLFATSYIDDIFILTKWKYSFDLTEKIADIFLTMAGTTFLYNIIAGTCQRFEKNFAANQKVAALVLSSARKSLRILFTLITINLIIAILGPNKYYLVLAKEFINIVIIGGIGWFAVQMVYTFEAILQKYMAIQTDHVRMKSLHTKLHITKNIATFIIIIITIAAILMSFSSVRNIGISLLASAGFLTAIIGLSAQKTLFGMFSSLQIALTQPIKIGDIVVIEKESGIVEQINFTHVTLKLGDRRRLMVPINYFIDKHFENWSLEGNSLRSSLRFYIDYMMPIEPIRAELDNILSVSKYWDGIAKKLQVSNLNEYSVEIRIQVSAESADSLSDLRAEVREKMLEFMRNNFPTYFPKVRQS